MNIKDIARIAKVSTATVSRAINDETRQKVAPKTLKRIEALIKKHGYTPDLAARQLNRVFSKTIGVAFPYFYSLFYHSYYVNILAGISDQLITQGYQFKILLCKEGVSWDNYDFRKGENIDGLIITHWPMFFSHKKYLEMLKVPSVVISDHDPKIDACFVCADQEMGGAAAGEHLCNLGHRRIVVLAGSPGSLDGEARLVGFLNALKKRHVNVPASSIIRADYREDFAFERIGPFFEAKERPTAVFCCNDVMAFGVLRKLKQMDIACPQKVSVVGYDNDIRGALSSPPLSTIETHTYDAAKQAAAMLVEHLKSSKSSQRLQGRSILPVSLFQRASTSRVHH